MLENPTETLEKHAEKVKKLTTKKILENPTETREKHAENEKKSKAKKILENPTETREKLAENKKKSRVKKILENPIETRGKHAEEEKKSRKRKIEENPPEILENEAKRKRVSRKMINELEKDPYFRLFLFLDNVRDGPIYACVCCHRIRYKNVVKIYNDQLKEEILIKSQKTHIIEDAIGTPNDELRVKRSDEDESSFYICFYCEKKLKQGSIPPVSHKNKLDLFNIKQYKFMNLSEAETALIATTILFQMFY